MNKKRIAALVAAGIIGISALAIAVNRNSKPAYALTAEEAKALAADVLPGTVEHMGTDEDDSQATFEYFDAETKTLFEVKVDLQKGEISNIREYKMDQELVLSNSNTANSDANLTNESKRERISRDEARDIALAQVEGAVADDIRELELDDRNDRNPEYEVELVYNGVKYEMEINALTGAVIEFEKEDRNTSRPVETQTTTSARSIISRDEARDIALAKVAGATSDDIRDFDLDDRNERDAKYEIDIVFDGYKYELEINAYSGDIVEFEREAVRKPKATAVPTTLAPTTVAPTTVAPTTVAPTTVAPSTVAPTTAGLITADEAMNIALARVPGAKRDHIREFELDRDDGRPEYEGEIRFNGVEYEFEIDARNGNILDWDVDHDDDDKRRPKSTTAGSTKAPAQTTQASLITRDRAIEIALAQVPGATKSHLEDVEFDEDDGRPEWEIEIEIGDYEYEIEIDARNGNIISMEIDD